MLANGPVRGLVVRCNRLMNFSNLTNMGYGASGCLRIDITSNAQQDWRSITGKVTPGSQAFKGCTISFTFA